MFTRAQLVTAVWIIASCAALAPQAVVGEDVAFKAGDRVITTSKGDVQAADGVVASLDVGVELSVVDVKEGWVGVAGEWKGKKIAGWMKPGVLAAVPAGSSDEAFQQGFAAHMRSDYAKAFADYTEAIRIDPKNSRAYNNRGLVYQARGDVERAIADFNEAQRLSPKTTSVYVNRGTLYARQSEFEKALADFSEAIKIDPQCIGAYRLRASVYEAMGFKTKAMADLRLAAKVYKPKYDTIAHKAIKLESQLKDKDFLPDYEAIDSIIDEFKARVQPQSTYSEQDILKILATIDAILLRRRFLGIDQGVLCDAFVSRRMTANIMKAIDAKKARFPPQLGEQIHFVQNLGMCLFYAAIGEATELPIRVVWTPGHAVVRWCGEGSTGVTWETSDGTVIKDAELEEKSKVSKVAVRNGVYLAPLSQNEMLSLVQANMALVWAGMWGGLENDFRNLGGAKRMPKAIEALGKAIELNPKLCDAYLRRAMLYGAMGDHEKAIIDASRAIQLDPWQSAAYFNRGVAWSARGDERKAIDDFSKSIELNPNQANAYFSRGLSRAKARDVEKALKDMDKAIELEPKFGNAYQIRSKLWEAMGNPERAKADMDKAKSLGAARR